MVEQLAEDESEKVSRAARPAPRAIVKRTLSFWRFSAVAAVLTACTFELAPLETDPPAQGGAAGSLVGGSSGIGGGLAGGGGSGNPGGGGAPNGGTAGTGALGGSSGMSGSGGTSGDASLGGGTGGGSGGSGGVKEGALLGTFALDYYWLTTEDEFPGTKDTKLYDSSCVLITTVTSAFATSLAQLGTGKLSSGTVLAYAGACACPTTPCYSVADAQHPWGYGVQNKALAPFRSIAVDKNEIAYGKHLYVPGFDGVTVPGTPPWGGFVHDGCVSADDTGGTLAGKDLSWFVALKPYYQSLDAQLGLTGVLVYEGGTRCP